MTPEQAKQHRDNLNGHQVWLFFDTSRNSYPMVQAFDGDILDSYLVTPGGNLCPIQNTFTFDYDRVQYFEQFKLSTTALMNLCEWLPEVESNVVELTPNEMPVAA